MTATDASAAVLGPLISLLLFAGFYVWMALALAAVFRKSGAEPWKAWVPVLNYVVLLQLAGLSPWLLLFGLLPFGLLVVLGVAAYRISVAFGYGAGLTVLAVVLLPAWASVIGFGSARWVGREQAEPGPRRSAATAPSLPSLPPFRAPGEGYGAPAYASAADGMPQPPSYGVTSAFAPAAPSAPPTVPSASPATRVDLPSSPPPATPAPEPVSVDPVVPPQPPVPAPEPAAAGAWAPPLGGWNPPPLPDAAEDRAYDAPAAAEEDAHGPARRSRRTDAEPHGSDETVPAEDVWRGWEGSDFTGEVTGAIPGAPGPISAVSAASEAHGPNPGTAPGRTPYSPPREDPEAVERVEDGPQPPVTQVPALGAAPDDADPWVPSRSPMSDRDAFPEASAPVSAVAGAPSAGGPMAARSSVSAFHAQPEIPDGSIEETVIARRRRTHWALIPPTGSPIEIGSETVILGRKPSPDPAYPGAQLISIQDGTVSKTHARLQLRDDRWYVTDLDSTNGVLFATLMGTEVEAPRGVEVEAGDRFLLGDAEIRLQRSDT
jgi:hypothetical protein